MVSLAGVCVGEIDVFLSVLRSDVGRMEMIPCVRLRGGCWKPVTTRLSAFCRKESGKGPPAVLPDV